MAILPDCLLMKSARVLGEAVSLGAKKVPFTAESPCCIRNSIPYCGCHAVGTGDIFYTSGILYDCNGDRKLRSLTQAEALRLQESGIQGGGKSMEHQNMSMMPYAEQWGVLIWLWNH